MKSQMSVLAVSLLLSALSCAGCGSNPPTPTVGPTAPTIVVYTAPVIPYQDSETAPQWVRDDCDWNRVMPRYLAEQSEGKLRVGEAAADGGRHRELSLVAVTLHTLSGSAYTGPKWLVLEGRLTEGGKLIGNFEVRRQTIAGSLSACKTLNNLGEEISSDILDWLDEPDFNSKLGNAS